jgi:hypothetical protein
MAKEWFYQVMGAELGPVSSAELKRRAQLGQIQLDTPIRAAPDGKWMPAERVKGLLDPPPVVTHPDPAKPVVPKPAVAAAAADTATIPLASKSNPTADRIYHFTGDTAVEITPPEEPASGEYDFFQMVGFELALGRPLHQALLDRCRTQHVTITELTRRAIAEHLGRKDLLEQPTEEAESAGVG